MGSLSARRSLWRTALTTLFLPTPRPSAQRAQGPLTPAPRALLTLAPRNPPPSAHASLVGPRAACLILILSSDFSMKIGIVYHRMCPASPFCLPTIIFREPTQLWSGGICLALPVVLQRSMWRRRTARVRAQRVWFPLRFRCRIRMMNCWT